MEAVEVVCVEIQENENGEIVYVEKMDNNNPGSREDFCVMECEIATSEHTSQSNFEENPSPVEILVFPNFNNELTHCISHENSLEAKKKTPDKNPYEVCLNNSELILHRDNARFVDKRKENEDFDIVLKLAMRNDSDESEVPVYNQFHDEKIIGQIPVVPTAEVHKSNLWTLLDKQNKCDSSLKQHGKIASNSLDVRKTYGSIIPKKTFTKKSDNGCLSEHPFRCKICDQSFRQDSSLKIHLKVHAGKYSDNCIIN